MRRRLAWLRVEGRFLRSRVARRIFASVVLCALLPISTFAILAYRQVTDQLDQEAEARLKQDAKQAGMSALEKLLLLDATLRVIAGSLHESDGAGSVEALPAPLRGLARGRFRAIAMAHGRSPTAADGSLLSAFASESPEDRRHLEDGRSLLRVLAGGQAPRVALAHLAPGPAGPRLVAGEIDPRVLFSTGGLRSGVTLVVTNDTGAPIFHGRDGASGAVSPETSGGGPSSPHAGVEHLTSSWDLFLGPMFRAPTWRFVLSQPEASVLAPVRHFRTVFPLVALFSLCGVGLASLVLIRRQLVPIETLHAATRRLAARDFGTRVHIASGDEFQDFGRSFNQMASKIERHLHVADTMNAVGTALSVERDHERLFDAILHGAMTVTDAAAGALHLVNAHDEVERRLLRATNDAEAELLAGPLDDLARRSVASRDTLEDPSTGVLSIPMQNHESEVIGVLQLVTAARRGSFPAGERRLAESLASQTAVTWTRDRLAGEFRGLFEGLIQLLVKAIDEKSPYTGAHCRRVPVLTEMIADAACEASEGPLKDFTLSPAERYELRIAALLHDCGKVTTPVHVQDKATKLEMLFDGIDQVDLRFEVVRRDLELAAARGTLTGDLDLALQELSSDRAFLRECNTGGETMDASLQQRVRDIASRWTWRGPDGVVQPILDAREVENLTIERGTLNAAEREIINQHVVATIQMLEQLPYPRNLRNVPFIAGCHHERMDGHGYPNHLTREQMSLQARILGLADVFEALTAKDRPYKPGMRVRDALGILAQMRDEGHIDPDLYEIFVGQKIYLRYAAQWLDPEQIDEDLLDEATLHLLEGVRKG